MDFKIHIPKVEIDTATIKEAGKTVARATNEGSRLVASVNLSCYKQYTLPVLGRPRELPEELCDEVTELVREMNANGWLEDDDIQWCHENNIPIL